MYLLKQLIWFSMVMLWIYACDSEESEPDSNTAGMMTAGEMTAGQMTAGMMTNTNLPIDQMIAQVAVSTCHAINRCCNRPGVLHL